MRNAFLICLTVIIEMNMLSYYIKLKIKWGNFDKAENISKSIYGQKNIDL